MSTKLLTIVFGEYRPIGEPEIVMSYDEKEKKPFVKQVKFNEKLFPIGKQIIKVGSKVQLTAVDVKEMCEDWGLNYVSHTLN